jgi:hypothetical protein
LEQNIFAKGVGGGAPATVAPIVQQPLVVSISMHYIQVLPVYFGIVQVYQPKRGVCSREMPVTIRI